MRRTTPARLWTDEEVATLRRLAADGKGSREIQREAFPERSVTSVSNKATAEGIRLQHTANKFYATSAPFAPIDGDPIPAWLDALRPVALPAPEPTTTQQTASDVTLIAGDFHFPHECPQTVAVFLETVRQLRPKRVILNGDTVDLLAVSRYPKDQRHTHQLRDEVTAFHAFLHRLWSLGQAWGMRIIETEANHSGNGTASRWHRYLSDRVPVLYAHDRAKELLAYETWFYPEWCPISLVESVVIADELLVIHGDIVRKNGAYSARGHMEKWQSSVLHSHTHRMGQSVRRIPSIPGRSDSIQRAYEIGCMCQLNPSYASAPDWTNGFAIVHEGHGSYGVELVSVVNGVATIAALGQTITAEG
jgi:hypothetical protein